jgi:protein TonB
LLLHAAIVVAFLALAGSAVIPEIKDPSLILPSFVAPPTPPEVTPQPPKPQPVTPPQQKPVPAPPLQASTPPPPEPAAPVEPPPEPPKPEPPPEVVQEQRPPDPVPTVAAPIVQTAITRPGVDIGSADAPIENVDRAPQLKTPIRARYPDEAVKAGVTSGLVIVKLTVDNRGNVVRSSIVQSVPLLDAAALEAAEKLMFEPARRRGIAVFSTVLLRINLVSPKP